MTRCRFLCKNKQTNKTNKQTSNVRFLGISICQDIVSGGKRVNIKDIKDAGKQGKIYVGRSMSLHICFMLLVAGYA